MGRPSRVLPVLVAIGGAAAVAAVIAVGRPWSPDTGRPAASATEAVTVLAAGDVARCAAQDDEATAELVESQTGAVVLGLGDLAYPNGAVEDFTRCYEPSWGQFSERTYAVPGNHEYRTSDAAPFFDYFGERAGERGEGWFSLDLGSWHLVALNSNCDHVGCRKGSAQERWLRSDLERHAGQCTLAFWHAPRFSSGARHGGTTSVEDLWQALLDHDVEMLLAGHEHLYERTAPLDAEGKVDRSQGVRTFVVGTGGGQLYELAEPVHGSEVAFSDTHGVLRLTLRSSGYDWEFLPGTPGGSTDAGSAECH